MIRTNEMTLIAVIDPTSLVSDSGGVYEYKADIYFKQFSNDDGSYVKDLADGRHKASWEKVPLITQWDLSLLDMPTVVLPCLNKGEHFESLITTPLPPNLWPDDPEDGDIPIYDEDEDKYIPLSPQNFIRYDVTTKQLQVNIAGVWTKITGGQAVPFPPLPES